MPGGRGVGIRTGESEGGERNGDSMKSVSDAFGPAMDEISRRRSVMGTHDNAATASYFSKDESGADSSFTPLPFALVSIGSNVLAPRPLHPSHTSLRVYGTFDSRDSAVDHKEILQSLDASCSYLIMPCNEWCMIPQTEDVMKDRAAHARRLEEVMQAHRSAVDAMAEDVERRRSGAKEGKTRDKMPVEAAEKTHVTQEEKEEEEAEREVYGVPKRLRAGGEVRGQSVVAMAIVPSEQGDCLFNVLGCFETCGAANAWVRNVGSRRHMHENIMVGATCEWLYPNKTRGVRVQYRNDELQRIMDAADDNVIKVKEYKDWQKTQANSEAEVGAAAANLLQLQDATDP